MPDKRRIHVTKHPDGWAVKPEGSRPIAVKETKEPAVRLAIREAKKRDGEAIIHKQERNEIQEERTYRKDPFPPRG